LITPAVFARNFAGANASFETFEVSKGIGNIRNNFPDRLNGQAERPVNLIVLRRISQE